MTKKNVAEPDSLYFLKIVLYLMAGFFWVRFSSPIQIGDFYISAFPLGLLIGLIFAHHDHFRLDRRIEYAVLLVATVVSYYFPAGLVL